MVPEQFREFTIGELAKAVSVAPSKIRYYESIGLVRSKRSAGGQRRYGAEADQALRYIAFAQAAGFTLSEISALNRPPEPGEPLFDHWQSLAEKKLKELDDIISRAEEMKRQLRHALDCRCKEPEQCGVVSGWL